MSALIIREAQPEDAERLLPLATELATSFIVDSDEFRRTFAQCVRDESYAVLVAEDGDALVGYLLGFDNVAFYANGRVSRIQELYVVPAHRRRGIARSLVAAFEEWARARSAAQIVVATRRAQGFYSAVGYEETAVCFRKVLRQ